MTGHDKRYRCARAWITFTLLDEDGNARCVTCGRVIVQQTSSA